MCFVLKNTGFLKRSTHSRRVCWSKSAIGNPSWASLFFAHQRDGQTLRPRAALIDVYDVPGKLIIGVIAHLIVIRTVDRAAHGIDRVCIESENFFLRRLESCGTVLRYSFDYLRFRSLGV